MKPQHEKRFINWQDADEFLNLIEQTEGIRLNWYVDIKTREYVICERDTTDHEAYRRSVENMATESFSHGKRYSGGFQKGGVW